MTDVPTEGPAFEAMMRGIDAKLKAEGVGIPSRPISAVGEVSIRYGDIPIPLGDGIVRGPPELERYRPLARAIRKWYDDTYGNRIKIDMSVGKIVLLLEGDLYALRIPQFFGSVNFTAQREWIQKAQIGPGPGPATTNVVQLVDGMTPGMAKSLSDEALLAIWSAFEIGLPACYTLVSTQSELVAIARNDVKMAVSNLMERHDHFGASKWASLQSAEKVLKAAIALKGARFKPVHDLEQLCHQLAGLGVAFDQAQLVVDIQCSPKIRYGEESCTREQALAAHQASLVLVNRLRNAGAGFELGLGG
ncbi:HEPN domain-containing protein [Sphingobium sp. B2]|uniref:HEPN domain-containing protein n=1 Tax=Sphingobium sp. B2 TaxID=2583228 RepID=UPI0011A66FCD|nr:HEPN domain-containing protein [Sphingobium sp. B2]